MRNSSVPLTGQSPGRNRGIQGSAIFVRNRAICPAVNPRTPCARDIGLKRASPQRPDVTRDTGPFFLACHVVTSGLARQLGADPNCLATHNRAGS